MNNRLKVAFTLIELLVVIAIVGILSGLIIVGMNNSVQSATAAKAQIFSASLKDSLLMNLVSEWKFENLTGVDTAMANGTVISDTWGINNGTTSGGTTGPILRSGSNCVYGQCLQFDGTDDYVNLGHDASLNMPDAVTIDLWVNFNDLSVEGYLLSKRTSWNTTSGYHLIFDKTTVNGIEVRGRVSNYARAGNAGLVTNRWYNIVGTLNDSGSANKVYINGINATTSVTTTETLENNALDLIIGANSPASSGYFNGKIDNIRIYNTTVPTSMIRDIYYTGLNKLLSKQGINISEYNERLTFINIAYDKF